MATTTIFIICCNGLFGNVTGKIGGYFMVEMKLALMGSLLCIIVGLGIIVGAGLAYPFINSTLNNVQNTVSDLLQQANKTIVFAQKTINSTQSTLTIGAVATNVSLPALINSSQLTSNIANNLTSIGSTVAGVGQALSSLSIAGISPFGPIANNVSSISQPLETAANYLQNISTSINSAQQQATSLPDNLNNINIQLDSTKGALADLDISINQAQNSLTENFNTIRLVTILALLGLGGLGVIFLLIGISLLSLRRRTIYLNEKIERSFAAKVAPKL
jgi:hypothetical protein